jgi:hypothetical protein
MRKAVSRTGFNALAFAVQKNDEESARLLLGAGLDPNFALPSGNKILMMAMAYGHTETASVLLDGGADIRATDRGGNTPLHIAAQSGNLVLIKQLLDKGADANARTAPASMQVGRGAGGGGGGTCGSRRFADAADGCGSRESARCHEAACRGRRRSVAARG